MKLGYDEGVEFALRYSSFGYLDPVIEAILMIDEARRERKKAKKLLSEAIKILEKEEGDLAEARLARARFFLAQILEPKEAERLLDSAIEAMERLNLEELPRAYLARARVYSSLKKYEAALRDLSKAIPDLRGVERAEAYMLKAYTYLFLSKKEEAIETLSEAIRKISRDKDLRIYLGELYRLRGEIRMYYNKDVLGARKDFLKAISIGKKLYEEDSRARVLLALSYRGLSRTEEPKKAYKSLIKALEFLEDRVYSEIVEAALSLAENLIESGEFLPAKRLLERLLEEDLKDRDLARAYLLLGEIYLEEELLEEAEISFKIALKYSHSSRLKSKALLGLAHLYIKRGEEEKSRALLEKVEKFLEKLRTGKIPCFLGKREATLLSFKNSTAL